MYNTSLLHYLQYSQSWPALYSLGYLIVWQRRRLMGQETQAGVQTAMLAVRYMEEKTVYKLSLVRL